MNGRRLVRNAFLLVMGSAVLAGTMGQGCLSFVPANSAPVVVNFHNATSQGVRPYFWADPNTIDDPAIVMGTAEDQIDLGPPLAPDEPPIVARLSCADAGTLVIDADLILVPSGALPSSNFLRLREGYEFDCGDTFDVYYDVDADGNLVTSAYKNGVYFAP